MLETFRGRPVGRALHLTVGVANAVPKLIVYRLLRPAFKGPHAVRLICREDNAEQLVAQLATYTLDVVVATAPAPPHVRVKVFNHLLGESGTALFAPAALAPRLKRGFPRSLRDAPMLLPTTNNPLRRALDDWFDSQGIAPRVVGEFEDSALMSAFGHGGGGAFAAPAAIERDVCRFYGVRVIGRVDAIRERYYAISAERRLKHPGVLAVTNAARDELFS
jgi:LysR family transcriptional activator of nhaA